MDRQALLLALLTIVVWASAYPGIRVGLGGYDPGALALFRFLVASATVGAAVVATRTRLPARRDLPRILVAGLVGISFYHAALNYGELRVPAGTASILIAFAPVVMTILAWLFLRERPGALAWAGIAVGFLGVATISLGGGGELGWQLSAGLILLCAVATAVLFNIEKPLFDRYGALSVTASVTWSGTLFLLVFAPALVREAGSAGPAATWSAVYIGVFPAAVGYMAWNAALARAPASRLAPLLYGVPVVALFVSWLWIGEVPTAWALVGGGLVVLGVALVNADRVDARASAGGRGDARRAARGSAGV